MALSLSKREFSYRQTPEKIQYNYVQNSFKCPYVKYTVPNDATITTTFNIFKQSVKPFYKKKPTKQKLNPVTGSKKSSIHLEKTQELVILEKNSQNIKLPQKRKNTKK